ncbi:MAG: putative RNA-binding protein with PUA-like domain [Parasphingorhabdus sp.]|jgi:predicted RNA-binding protein with PUA-like domain
MPTKMNYWLLKSEPDVFSIDHLKAMPKKTDHWDGIRNYQARNFMRDGMKKGELAFFYHSNCDEPGIVGIAKIVREAYPDHTAFDPESNYFDAKSDPDNPRWLMVDVKYQKKFKTSVSLKALKAEPRLTEMVVVQKGSRLSITPVNEHDWQVVLEMAGEKV